MRVALRCAVENNEIKQIIQLQDTRKAKYNYAHTHTAKQIQIQL